MIIDAGGLLLILLVLTVPVAVYLIQRGRRSRTNDLLGQILALQRQLGDAGDPLTAINDAGTGPELDAAVERNRAQQELARLADHLPPELRARYRRGAR